MLFSRIGIILVVGLTTASLAARGDGNLVSNPSFESGQTGWNELWSPSAILTSDSNSGSQAVRIGSASGGVKQAITTLLIPGHRYELQAYAKVGQTGEPGSIGMKFETSSGGTILKQFVTVTSLTYAPSVMDFTAPASFYKGVVYAWKDVGSSFAYFDDVSVVDINTIACPIDNGVGQQTWSGTAYGSCTLVSCNSGYHASENACQPDVIACTVDHGTGLATWNGTDYDACVATACDDGYHVSDGVCVLNPAPHVSFATQPGGAGVSVGWPVQPVVNVLDADGNLIPSSSINVVLSLAANPTGAKLRGLNINVQAVNGVATFSNLSLDQAGTYQLVATARGFRSATSEPFTINAPGGTTYYVSPTGADTNDGLSTATAWQTVGKVNASTLHAGDSVLFQGGQVFAGCLEIGQRMQATAAQPITIGSYGTGPFQLDANCTKQESPYNMAHDKSALHVGPIAGFVLQDCILRGNESQYVSVNPQPVPPIYGAAYGVFFDNGGVGSNLTTSSVTIQRCDISGFFSTQGFAGGIFFNSNGPTSHISLIDNVIHGSSGPTSPDDNGIAVSGNAVKNRLTDVVVQGNHIYNIGSRAGGGGGTLGNGIVLGGKHVLIQNNVSHANGANTNTCGGPANIWAVSGSDITIQYNESYAAAPRDPTVGSTGPNAGGCDWNGYDLDIDVTNSVVQYNYSHDNFGTGLLAYMGNTWGPNTFRYNISVADGYPARNANAFAIANTSNNVGVVYFYNNLLDNQTYSFGSQGTVTHGIVANNIFKPGLGSSRTAVTLAKTNGSALPNLQLLNNAYWSSLATETSIYFSWSPCPSNGCRSVAQWQTTTGQDPYALTYLSPSTPGTIRPAGTITCNISDVTGAVDFTGLTTCLAINYRLNGGSGQGHGLDLTQAPYSLNVGARDFFGNILPTSGSGTPFSVGPSGN